MNNETTWVNPSAKRWQDLTWLVVANIGFRVLSGLTTIALIFFLPPEQYGQYSFAVFWSWILVLICTLGLPEYLVKVQDLQLFRPAMVLTSLLAWVIGGVLLVVLNALVSWWLLIWFFFAAWVIGINDILLAALRTKNQFRRQAYLVTVNGLLLITFLPFLAWQESSLKLLGQCYLAIFLLLFLFHWQRDLKGTALNRLLPVIKATLPYGWVATGLMVTPVVIATLGHSLLTKELSGSFNLFTALFLAGTSVVIALDQGFFAKIVKGHSRYGTYGLVSMAFAVGLPLGLYFMGILLSPWVPSGYQVTPTWFLWLGLALGCRFISQWLIVGYRLEDALVRVGYIQLLTLSLSLLGILYWQPNSVAQLSFILIFAECSFAVSLAVFRTRSIPKVASI